MYTAIKRKKPMIWLLNISVKHGKYFYWGHWGVATAICGRVASCILYLTRIPLSSLASQFTVWMLWPKLQLHIYLFWNCIRHCFSVNWCSSLASLWHFFLLFTVFLNGMHLSSINFCLVCLGYFLLFISFCLIKYIPFSFYISNVFHMFKFL